MGWERNSRLDSKWQANFMLLRKQNVTTKERVGVQFIVVYEGVRLCGFISY